MEEINENPEENRKRKRACVLLSAAALELTVAYGVCQFGGTVRSEIQEQSHTEITQQMRLVTTGLTTMDTVEMESIPYSTTEASGVIISQPETLTTTARAIPVETTLPVEPSSSTETIEVTTETLQEVICQFVIRGSAEDKEIAFTFDDSGEDLARILEILDRKGIKGSFFLLAGELKANPELWQQAAANGHLILNHTVNHYTNLEKKSEETIRKEVLGWEETAKEVLGEEYLTRMKTEFPYFRSPGGLKSERLLKVLGELGYATMFYWSVEDIYFSSHNPQKLSLCEHYVKDAENGAVFLLHPGHWDHVEEIIDDLTEEGYAFVPVSEILE